jgi:hypothetical protein
VTPRDLFEEYVSAGEGSAVEGEDGITGPQASSGGFGGEYTGEGAEVAFKEGAASLILPASEILIAVRCAAVDMRQRKKCDEGKKRVLETG